MTTTNTMTTAETITRKQLRALREEASQHGDTAQVEMCDRALDGDEQALAACAEAIAHAEAQS